MTNTRESFISKELVQSNEAKFIELARRVLKIWQSKESAEKKQELIFSDEILGEIEKTAIPLGGDINWRDKNIFSTNKQQLGAFVVDQVLVKFDDLLKKKPFDI